MSERESIDFLQIVVQGAHVCGDAFGALQLHNVIRNRSGVTVFVTQEKVEIPVSSEWETTALTLEDHHFEQLVRVLHATDGDLVTNLRGDEDPLDYQVLYFVNGVIAERKIALRVEHVLRREPDRKNALRVEEVVHREPEKPPPVACAIREFLESVAAVTPTGG